MEQVINYSNYLQKTVIETLTSKVYARVLCLYDCKDQKQRVKYIIEVFFKYSHEYECSSLMTSKKRAMKLYNSIIS